MFQLIFSTLLLAISFYVVITGVVVGKGSLVDKEELGLEEKSLNTIILIISYITLFLNEGFQVAAMRVQYLKSSDLDMYPRTKKCHSLLFPHVDGIQTSNMPRLFIGQSFLVVLCTFLLARLTKYDDQFEVEYCFNMEFLTHIMSSQLMGVFFTVNLAQLLPSLLAKNYPIQFLQLPMVYSLIKLALIIENSGVVNFTYLVVEGVDKIVCGTKSGMDEKKNKKVTGMSILDVCKYMISILLTLSCVAFVLFSIGSGYSAFTSTPSVQICLLIVGMSVVFYYEGLKIAIVSKYEDIAAYDESTTSNPTSPIIKLLSKSNDSVERFLLGRQQIVVPIGFLIAQINHFDIPYLSANLPAFLYFLLTGFGLPAVIVLLVFSQLSPQLLAAGHMEKFLRLPGSFVMVYMALIIEKLGITTAISSFVEFVKSKYPPRDVRFDQVQNPLNIHHDGEIEMLEIIDYNGDDVHDDDN